MITVQRATRTELASTLQQSGLSVRAFCTSAGLPKTTVRRFLGGKVVRPSTHNQIHKALRAYQADRLTAVQSANAASRQCYLDGVTLVDDLLESEKSRLREQVARLEVTVRTQAENIAAYQKSLLECDQQCESRDDQICEMRVKMGALQLKGFEYRTDLEFQRARIENHVTQAVEYERYVKELDDKCQSLTAQLMTDSEPSNAYDDHNAHQEFIDGLGRGAKYTFLFLVFSALVYLGWYIGELIVKAVGGGV